MKRSVDIRSISWPLRRPFHSAYGTTAAVDTIEVVIRDGDATGRGEARAFRPYGTTVESIVTQVRSLVPALEDGLDRLALQPLLPPGAARNAVDCALWDLSAKESGMAVWKLSDLPAPAPVRSIVSISAVTPDEAAAVAVLHSDAPWFKVKLSGRQDIERVMAVHSNAPGSKIVVDPNCSWSRELYEELVPILAPLNVAMIEQPLPVGLDESLAVLPRPIPLCADESCTDLASLGRLHGLYDVISIKLDKAGGLTEALHMRDRAAATGFGVMVSCMISTSLGMAPTVLLAAAADFADLGGEIELIQDYEPSLTFEGGYAHPPPRALWG